MVAVVMMLLPVLLVAAVLWRTFATQVDDSYEKRLTANLNLFGLAVDQGLDDFRRALSRLTADNTIQVTVDLDIRPQLNRYLSSQFDVSDFDFVAVTDREGQVLAAAGSQSVPGPDCKHNIDRPTEGVAVWGDRLLVTRTLPLSYKGRFLGYLCAGYALNGAAVVDKILSRVDGFALMSWRQLVFSISDGAPQVDLREGDLVERV